MSAQVEEHPVHHQHPVVIVVNDTRVTMPDQEATGAQIKATAEVPAGENLFEIVGGQERPIGDNEVIHLHEGETFESGPDGTVS